ncbi:MAG: VOC family protein [bacterium]|nr:VOC family protein [bacterium]
MIFDHLGLITTEKKENEIWVEPTRVWVTDPSHHPYRIEWLRYEPDSPVTGPVRNQPHLAFRVDNIEQAAAGLNVLLAPFQVNESLRVGFFESKDKVVIEFMEYKNM